MTLQHGFNAANDKLIRVLGAEISSKQGNESDVLVSELVEDITAPQTRIDLSFAALAPCCQASSFAEHKPRI